MTDTLALTLRKPITLGNTTVEVLYLREPTVSELDRAQAAGGSSVGVTLNMLSYVTGHPPALLGRMGIGDFSKASAFIEGFTRGGPATGEASSPGSPSSTAGVLGPAGI